MFDEEFDEENMDGFVFDDETFDDNEYDNYDEMMEDEDSVVLCASSAYDKKFYFNEEFDSLPQTIKDQLKILSVLFTTDVGGILTIKFNEEGDLLLESHAPIEDLLFDEIGSHLRIKKMLSDERDLFESLETYFKVFYLGMEIDE